MLIFRRKGLLQKSSDGKQHLKWTCTESLETVLQWAILLPDAFPISIHSLFRSCIATQCSPSRTPFTGVPDTHTSTAEQSLLPWLPQWYLEPAYVAVPPMFSCCMAGNSTEFSNCYYQQHINKVCVRWDHLRRIVRYCLLTWRGGQSPLNLSQAWYRGGSRSLERTLK